MVTVSVTTWPALRSPLPPPSMPAPETATEVTAGAVVSICSVPAGSVTAPERLASLLSQPGPEKDDPSVVVSDFGLATENPPTVASMVGSAPATIGGDAD